MMTASLFSLRHKLAALPRTWLATLVLAGVGLFAYLALVLPAERKLAELNRQFAIMHVKASVLEKSGRFDPGRQLAVFYRQFPERDSTPDWLDKMYEVAKGHKLLFARGDYRLVDDPMGGLSRYQITLPLRGSYLDIRAFIKDVLAQVPAVALDNVSFERQKIGDPSVQATVKMTLFLRRSP